MSQVTIYHNPRCSKSRQTLELLENQGADIDIVRYIEEPLSSADVSDLLLLLNMIERPIVVRDGKAVIGRPPEKVLELFA